MKEPLEHDLEIVEDALRSWPRAQTPRGFSSRVLQRIENTAPHAGGTLKFRLTWLDLALGLFTISIPPVFLFIWNSLPLTVLRRLQFRLSMLQSAPQIEALIVFGVLGLFGLTALFALALFLFIFPAAPRIKNPGQ